MGRTIRQIKDASEEVQNEIRKSGEGIKQDFQLQKMVDECTNMKIMIIIMTVYIVYVKDLFLTIIIQVLVTSSIQKLNRIDVIVIIYYNTDLN